MDRNRQQNGEWRGILFAGRIEDTLLLRESPTRPACQQRTGEYMEHKEGMSIWKKK